MSEVFNHFLDDDIYRVPNELTILLHDAADEGDQVAIGILEKTAKNWACCECSH